MAGSTAKGENGGKSESSSLGMRNFPKSWMNTGAVNDIEAKLRKLLKTFGEVTALEIAEKPGEPTQAIATFVSVEMAHKAVKALHGVDMRTAKEKRETGNRPPTEDERFWAQIQQPAKAAPEDAPPALSAGGVPTLPDGPSSVPTLPGAHETYLHVEGFPTSWTEAQLRATFLTFSGVARLTYVPDSRYGRVARILLKDAADMHRAVKELDGAKVGDGDVIEECVLACRITSAAVQKREEEDRKRKEEKAARKMYRADVRKRREDRTKGAPPDEKGSQADQEEEEKLEERMAQPDVDSPAKVDEETQRQGRIKARKEAARKAAQRFEQEERDQEEVRKQEEQDDAARLAAAAYTEAKLDQQRRQDEETKKESQKAAAAAAFQEEMRNKAKAAAERREKEAQLREQERARREEKKRVWEADRMRREEERQRREEKKKKAEEERLKKEEEDKIRKAEARVEAEKKREEERVRKEEKMRKYEESRMRREEVRSRNEIQREHWEEECMRREEKLQRWVDEQVKIAAEKKKKQEEERKRKHEEEMRRWEEKRMRREEELQIRYEKALEMAKERKKVKEEERVRLREEEKTKREEEMRRYEESRMRREEELQRWLVKVIAARKAAEEKRKHRQEESLRKEEKMRRWEEDRMLREELRQRKEEKKRQRDSERLKREDEKMKKRKKTGLDDGADAWQDIDVAGWAATPEEPGVGTQAHHVPSARPKQRARASAPAAPDLPADGDEETDLDRLLAGSDDPAPLPPEPPRRRFHEAPPPPPQVPSARPKQRAQPALPVRRQEEDTELDRLPRASADQGRRARDVPSARPKQRAARVPETKHQQDGEDTEPPTASDDTEPPTDDERLKKPAAEPVELEPTSMVDSEDEEVQNVLRSAKAATGVPSARPKQRARTGKSAEELEAERQAAAGAARLEEMYREEQTQRQAVEDGLWQQTELDRLCRPEGGRDANQQEPTSEAESDSQDRSKRYKSGQASNAKAKQRARATESRHADSREEQRPRYDAGRDGREDRRRKFQEAPPHVPSARPKQRARGTQDHRSFDNGFS